MLDNDIIDQLKTYFSDLGPEITLVMADSAHPKQQELRDMLTAIVSTSSKIKLLTAEERSDIPEFKILRDGLATGMQFAGIPGGHEFTSLIVAILNAGGRGKLPDAGLSARMKRLRPGRIRTFISLSCENCPDVVQALNQIALIHGGIEHTMIDGEYRQEELSRLGAQGVPSVFIGDQLLHSGRSTLADLLTKLEITLGTAATTDQSAHKELGHFDVVVMGGGPAGASSAIYSVRKGLKTALIAEKIGGQMTETKGIENLISVVYTEGPQLSANVDQHLRSYPVEILEHRRIKSVTDSGTNKRLTLDSGETLTADQVIVATGAKWRELNIPGEKEYLGRGVAFCPHCDGPYYKGKKVSVIGGGNSGVEAAIDLAGICAEVTVIEFADALKADDFLVKKLTSLPNVSVIIGAKTSALIGDGQKITGLDYVHRATGQTMHIDLDGVFVQIGLSPNSAIVKDLVETNKFGEIVVDTKGRTSRAGVYAAGDVTTVPFKQIIIAMGEGAKVALTAFEDRMRQIA
jgi:alkyl hydroperoxide reductase subunit F